MKQSVLRRVWIDALLVASAVVVFAGLGSIGLNSARAAPNKVKVATSQLQALSAGLSMYVSDQGRFPRLASREFNDEGAMRDDCVALWAGLMNMPTRKLGGGGNAPYVESSLENLAGFYSGGVAGLAGGMPTKPDGSNDATPLSAEDVAKLTEAGVRGKFQEAHLPGSKQALVFLDPWGNPIHYREWASLRDSAKDNATETPVKRSLVGITPATKGSKAPLESALDMPHRAESFDLWSNGPNGVNEYGAPGSDDVTIWAK